MREVIVAGGYADELQTGLSDALGSDLADASVWAALVAEGADYPEATDPAWVVVTVADGVASVPVTSSQASGHFWLWLKVQQGGRVWLVRVMDPDKPVRPWLIYVH